MIPEVRKEEPVALLSPYGSEDYQRDIISFRLDN